MDAKEQEDVKKGNINNIILDKLTELISFDRNDNVTLKALNIEHLKFRYVIIHGQCHKFLKFFHQLQSYFAVKKLKSFMVAPVMKIGIMHITFTNTGLDD